jgi:hypothetical protein
MAVIVGPVIGGLLARPAVQYPTVFDIDGLFGRLPYLLPCLVVSGTAALCLVLSHFALEETVPDALGFRCLCCSRRSAGTGRAGASAQPAKRKGQLARFFCLRRAFLPMVCYCLLILAEWMSDVAFPLWTSAPLSAGGLDFSPMMIGQVMAGIGFCVIPVQLILFPWLQGRVGSLAIARWGTLMSGLATPILPFATYPISSQPPPVKVWTCIILGHVLRYAFTEMVFISNNLLSNNAVVQADRGSYVGIMTTASCIGRIVGPLASGPLVAWSLTNGATSPPFNHFFVFLLCSATLLVNAGAAFAMPRSMEHALLEEGDVKDSDHASTKQTSEDVEGEKQSLLAGGDEDDDE